MEIECPFSDVIDADRSGQEPIHRSPEILRRDRILYGDRRHLRPRVHAGIGAARTRYMHRPAFDAADDFFQDTLNCRQSRLDLPAIEIGTVIRYFESQSAHVRVRFAVSPA